MANRDGLSDATRKVGVEQYYAYCLTDADKVGDVPITAAGTGTWAADAGFTFDTVDGDELVVRASAAIRSTTDIVVTVTGTKFGGGAINATVTIPALSPEGASFDLRNAAEENWASITAVTFTGGVIGDGFEIHSLPADSTFVDMDFVESAKFDVGGTVKPVPKHYEPVDHNKRIRGENTLTMSELYGNNEAGLARIKNRDVLLRVRVHTDGAAVASETRYYSTCRTTVPINMPSNDEFVMVEAQGRFGKEFVFS
jgi:hypothetical protein